MKKPQLRIVFSSAIIFSMMAAAVSINAAPVRFNQVVQVVNAKPGKAGSGNFSQLRLIRKNFYLTLGDDDEIKGGDDKKKGPETAAPQQDDRVITTTTEEIAENEECDCVEAIEIIKPGFPKWPFFGLAAIPLAFIPKKDEDPTPTPTMTMTPTPTPTTPTPTPPPVPEPMTLLLFGTGLAGIGMAARKKFGKKGRSESE